MRNYLTKPSPVRELSPCKVQWSAQSPAPSTSISSWPAPTPASSPFPVLSPAQSPAQTTSTSYWPAQPPAPSPAPAETSLVLQDFSGCASFADSLALNMTGKRRHPKACAYFTEFRSKRAALARDLYIYFNATVFQNRLPADMEIEFTFQEWSSAGTTIIGYKGENPCCKIFLSIRHLENAQRVRDVLIHEMCHVAAWMIDGNHKAGHGPGWLKWTTLAEMKHPDIKIERFYRDITLTNYLYKCVTCDNDIGVESPLPNTLTTCYMCGGRFERVDIYDPDLYITFRKMEKMRPDLSFAK